MTKNNKQKNELYELQKAINFNNASKEYFYQKVKITSLSWLYENKFFDILNEEVKEDGLHYNLPELNYLKRCATENNQNINNVDIENKLITIIENTTINDNTNKVVLDTFVTLISNFNKIDNIEKLIEKMLNDKWLNKMFPFTREGYRYTDIVKKLGDHKKYKTLFKLAESFYTKNKKSENENVYNTEYLVRDFDYSGIFDYLKEIENIEYLELAINTFLRIQENVFYYDSKTIDNSVFDKDDFLMAVMDRNIFEIEIEENRSAFNKILDRNVLAILLSYIRKYIDFYKNDIEKLKELLNNLENKNILENKISFTYITWRLKLYIILYVYKNYYDNQNQEINNFVKEKAKEYLFFPMKSRLEDKKESVWHLISGVEYDLFLQNTYNLLDDTDKDDYVNKLKELLESLFDKKDNEENNIFNFKIDNEKIWKDSYYKKCASIKNYLTDDKIKEIEKITGRKYENITYKPRPEIESSSDFARSISSQSPVNIDWNSLEINKIIELLKNDFHPSSEIFSKENNFDNIYSPKNPEGLMNDILKDFESSSERMKVYIKNITLFFEPGKGKGYIHSDYTYKILQKISTLLDSNIHNNKSNLFDINDLKKMIDLCEEVAKYGKENTFIDESKNNASMWLIGWIGVHITLSYIIKNIGLNEIYREELKNNTDERVRFLSILDYLLKYKESPNEEKELNNDPLTNAINSVRGVAVQSLVDFICDDYINSGNKIQDDIKKIYKYIVENEKAPSAQFMIGRLFIYVFTRDEGFGKEMYQIMFPKEKQLFLKNIWFWAGYVTGGFNKKTFDNLKDIYNFYIENISNTDYKQVKFDSTSDIETGLAIHIGNDYLFFKDLKLTDKIFENFWKSGNGRAKELIKSVGHIFLNVDHENYKDILINGGAKKLTELWDFALDDKNETPQEVFKQFALWISDNESIIKNDIDKLNKSLIKSKGEAIFNFRFFDELDNWATKEPELILDLLRNFLLPGGNINTTNNDILWNLNKIQGALEIIYKNQNQNIKDKTKLLINDLIEKYSNNPQFLTLKDVLDNNN